jgi:hypothetical protein
MSMDVSKTPVDHGANQEYDINSEGFDSDKQFEDAANLAANLVGGAGTVIQKTNEPFVSIGGIITTFGAGMARQPESRISGVFTMAAGTGISYGAAIRYELVGGWLRDAGDSIRKQWGTPEN